jgi:hypothetical protein
MACFPLSDAFAANIGNATYGVYTETYEGIKYGVANPGDVDGGYIGAGGVAIGNTSDDVVVSTEGSKCLKAIVNGNGGWWSQFGDVGQVETDMSAYSGGSIDFMVKTSTDIIIKLEWTGGSNEKKINADLGVPLDNYWHHVSTSLASFTGIDLQKIKVPAGFHTVWDTTQGTYWIDNVAWKKSTAGSVSITLKNISDDLTTNQISWSNVTLGSTVTWKAADQYIELGLTYYAPVWGIQIYTDNKAADANPQYSGSGNPAGLIDTIATTKRLPICWRMVDVSTDTLTVRQTPDYHLYSQELANTYYCWLFMQDRNTAGFADAADSVTVWDMRGMHYSEGQWGGAVSPNYIYLGADFTDAVTPRTYTTGKLTIELFYE